MKISGIFIPIFVVLIFKTVPAAILNVPGDYATIQEALDSQTISDGDTVLVQPGIYTENIDFSGMNVIVGSLFLTTGDKSYITSTMIDGDSSGSVVTFARDEDDSAAVIGFTIRNGYAENGGGILCINSSPTISDNIIIGNEAGREGGGLYCSNSSPIIRNNTITANRAVRGGGISHKYNNSVNSGRNADVDLIARRNSFPSMVNNIISGNSASWGGGIYCPGSRFLIQNNTVTRNTADKGGGIFCLDSKTVVISTIFWENTADEGAEIFSGFPNVSYSNIQGGWEGDGNIDLDPLFRDAENGDFRLMSVTCGDADDSPCIDAGSPGFIDSLIDCSWGLGTVLSDIGAYGGGAIASPSEQVLHIPDDFETIQRGINASSDGDTVLVYPGTYMENINFGGRRILVASLYLFTRNYSHISSTIIDGNSSGSVVTFENGEDSSAVLAGFTIENGLAENGAGIFCFYSAPVIKDNIISENAANSEGGGIFCFFSDPIIENNVIQENIAFSGGGINCRYSNPVINGNLLIGNQVSWEGGGIFCRDNSAPMIKNNDIRENWADYGGGIMCRYSNPSINNTVISKNSANRGGGIFCVGSNLSMSNLTIAENTAEYGGGIFCLSSSLLIINTVVWHNIAEEGEQIYGDSPRIIFSDIQGGWEGEGNIDLDPLFRDTTESDFHLMFIECGNPNNSPCIDSGHPAVSDSLLDCSWGLGTTDSDMGAYGGGGSMTGIDEVNPDVSRRLALARNYPNPFNVSTSLEYNLLEASYLTIDIYNILGQRVETVFEGEKPAGNHVITWDASAFPSGVYFARLKTPKSLQSTKMVLLK